MAVGTAISPRKRIWGWYFFDWASQPYSTILLTFIFGPYFAEVARAHYMAQGMTLDQAGASAQIYWSTSQAVTGMIIALLSPILGAVADGSGNRMGWIRFFSLLYVVGAFALWWVYPDNPSLFWPVFWFSLGFIGMEFATNFTNALMPDLASKEDMGKVSGSGFAFGYVGGVVSLALILLFFAESGKTGLTFAGIRPVFGLDPETREGTRAAGPFTAIWYIIFMIPFALWVRERSRRSKVDIRRSLLRLKESIKGLKARPSLFAYLGSSMFYRDGMNALYGLGGAYASNVLGWSVVQSGTFGVIAAVTASVFSWLGGRLDSRFGPKPVIVTCILILIALVSTLVGLTRNSFFGVALPDGSPLPDQIFYLCGAVIGAAGGVLQAASRTLMVFHTAPGREAEAFGLYGLTGKATTFLAPAMISAATMAFGSPRFGLGTLVPLFILGLVLLLWVNPDGERHES